MEFTETVADTSVLTILTVDQRNKWWDDRIFNLKQRIRKMWFRSLIEEKIEHRYTIVYVYFAARALKQRVE